MDEQRVREIVREELAKMNGAALSARCDCHKVDAIGLFQDKIAEQLREMPDLGGGPRLRRELY